MKKINKIKDYLSMFSPRWPATSRIDSEFVNIDLNSSCNHLGDVLFFAPLIMSLKKSGIDVYVNDRYSFYSNIFGISPIVRQGPTLGRSFDSKERALFRPGGHVNFYDFEPGPISRSIHNRFVNEDLYECSLRAVKSMLMNFSNEHGFELNKNITNSDYFVVAPSLNSRTKGFFPNQKRTEEEFITNLQGLKSHCCAVLVGEQNAVFPSSKRDLSSYVDLDIRGQTKWSDLIPLIANPRCKSVLSYDTFPYHLATLLDKETNMLSRSWLTGFEHSWISQRFMPAF